MKLVNIHTHIPSGSEHVIEIVNVLPKDFTTMPNWPNMSLGIHPWFIDKNYLIDLDQLYFFSKEPGCKAIGECGLDKVCKTPWELQNEVFIRQVKWAENIRKPIIIHCVRAYNEIIEIKKQLSSTVPWIIHGFTGKFQTAQQLLKQGIRISIGSTILQNRPTLHHTLHKLDLNDFFLETDDAETSIHKVYEKTAAIRNVSLDKLAQQKYFQFTDTFQIVN